MISVCFQGKPFKITVVQVYDLTNNAEEAETEWFCEGLQDLVKPTPKKYVLFIKGDWNVKVGSEEALCKKAKWLSEEALQIAVKRREVKRKDIPI